jgi:hypothetical protein
VAVVVVVAAVLVIASSAVVVVVVVVATIIGEAFRKASVSILAQNTTALRGFMWPDEVIGFFS